MLYLDNHLEFLKNLFNKINKSFNENEKLKEQLKELTESEVEFLIREIDDYRFTISSNGYNLIPKSLEEQDILFLWIFYQNLFDNLDDFFLFRKFIKENYKSDFIKYETKDLNYLDIKDYQAEFDLFKSEMNDLSKDISNKIVIMWL